MSVLAPAERLARQAKAKLEAMAQKPPSAAQLEYLKALGDTLKALADMAEASARIEQLTARNSQALEGPGLSTRRAANTAPSQKSEEIL